MSEFTFGHVFDITEDSSGGTGGSPLSFLPDTRTSSIYHSSLGKFGGTSFSVPRGGSQS